MKKHFEQFNAPNSVTRIVISTILLIGLTIATILAQEIAQHAEDSGGHFEAEFDHNDNLLLESIGNDAMRVNVFRTASPDEDGTRITLSATLSPVTVENKNVLWTMKWKGSDAGAAWGEGKTVTDYLSLSTERSLTGENVSLTCLKDFGEQIIVTATAESDANLFAECSVDYCQKIKSIGYRFKYGEREISTLTEDANGVFLLDYTGEELCYTVECTPEYTEYTVADNFEKTIEGKFSDAFGAQNSLSAISLQAGLFGTVSEPAPSEKATAFINAVDSVCSHGNWQVAAQMAANAAKDYDALTPGDKLHSKVTNRNEALRKIAGNCNSAAEFYEAQTEAKKILAGYVPKRSGDFHGLTIESEDALLTSAKNCITADTGIMQYTIRYAGEHSTTEFHLKLGYTEASVQAARNITTSLPSVLF